MQDSNSDSQSPEASSGPPDFSQHPARRWFWRILKWTLCLVVLVFVGKRAVELWDQDELQQLDLDLGWLILAGVVYVTGWLPSVWFWQKLMHSLGARVDFRDAARAYFCGHLGKYVPGKATVLVIRAALIKQRGYGAATAAVTATYETLLMMGAGLVVAVALSPAIGWPKWDRWFPVASWIPAVAAVVGTLLSLPLLSRLLTYFAVKMTPRDMLDPNRTVKISPQLIASGLIAFVVSWAMLGLSLGLILHAISHAEFRIADWPVWTAGVSVATVIGFAAIFAPGGVGVREGLLIEVLSQQQNITERQAVAAAILLRLVWLVGEIGTAAALYYLMKPKPPDET